MEEKISVIIPVYKVENYLRQCVKSIILQTYKNLEIILVDDGSPDSCPQICEELAKDDGRIIVIHKKNGGVSSARNMGLKNATGCYVVFIDSDDIVHARYIEILYKTLKNNKADIAMCDWQKIYRINKVPSKKINQKTISISSFENDDVFGLLFNKKVPLIMAVWAKIFKREIFKNILFYEGVVQSEDDKIMPEILNQCKKLTFINVKMYYNLQRKDSLTGVQFSKKRLIALDVLKDRIDFVKQNRPQFTDESIYYFLKISILYYYYAKWAKFEKKILINIKQSVENYNNQGYSNKLIKLFLRHPKILEVILKIRKGINRN